MFDLIQNNKNLVIIVSLIFFFIILYFLTKKTENLNNIMNTELNIEHEIEEHNDNKEHEITKDNLNSKIKVYNFNTSWCSYSVMFAPEWSKFEAMVENNENIDAIDIKCDDENNNSICKTFDVPGFPSVVIVKDNKKIDYQGQRNAEAIFDFINTL